jgi:hypothetical protein
LSVRAFCQRERLTESGFYAWRRTIGERDDVRSRQITNILNAVIVSHVGDHYVIRAESWNRTIAQGGGSVSFGFQGAGGNVENDPENTEFNGLPVV